MRPLLKSLLLWLLALALPVQALAAAGMQHCGATHERMRAASAAHPTHDHLAGAGHGHQHDFQPDLPHGDRHHPASDAASAPAADDASGPSGAARFTCSACATCCFALALPVAEVRAASQLPDGFAPAPPAEPVPPFVTGGLERPPRTFLA